MDKKGGLLDEESVRVILAVGVVVLMLFLIIKLFSPVYSEEDEIAKSYLNMLEDAIESADGVKESSFFMLDNGKDADFYLTYFGSVKSFGNEVKTPFLWAFSYMKDKSFVYIGREKTNVVCICYWNQAAVICRACSGLDLPLIFSDGGNVYSDSWAVAEGRVFDVKKKGGSYEISAK